MPIFNELPTLSLYDLPIILGAAAILVGAYLFKKISSHIEHQEGEIILMLIPIVLISLGVVAIIFHILHSDYNNYPIEDPQYGILAHNYNRLDPKHQHVFKEQFKLFMQDGYLTRAELEVLNNYIADSRTRFKYLRRAGQANKESAIANILKTH